MIKLIACDIDGTLLHGAQTRIRPQVLEQARRLMDKGIAFCPASGRQYSSLCRLFGPIVDRMFCICENGAVLFGPGGQLLHKTAFKQETAMALCHAILETDNCEVLISGTNTSYLCPKGPDIVDHMRYFVGNNTEVLHTPEEVPEDIVKISAYCRQGAETVEPVLAPQWQSHCNSAIAGEKWLDFTLTDKGAGITQLCRILGVALEDVMAFGDSYNDLPMLELVGHPCIMDNAADALRRRFGQHCAAVEDVLSAL